MMLWVAMAVLAAVASLSILVPLYRTRTRGDIAAAHEASVYRDQIEELDRELERGVVASGEAEAARAEIARRLIRAARPEAAPAAAPGGRRVAMAAAVAIVVPIIALGLYIQLGSPALPDLPLAARQAAPTEDQDISVLVARVEAHLAEHPDDGAGWEVIAPVYVRLGRYDDAVEAYANVVRLLGSTAEREAGLGAAMVQADGGRVGAEARAAFERALRLQPEAPAPRFYLALALAQDGDIAAAETAFRDLLAAAPTGAPWIPAVQAALAGLDADSEAPEPSAEDIAAASELSAEDRAAMIEGMVGRLAARLEEEPGDANGWARLIRSYMVLRRPDEARTALDRARLALDGNPDKLAVVESAAQAAGLLE